MSDGPTGDATVDAALAPLVHLAQRPLADHPDVLDDLHQTLHSHLVDEPTDEAHPQP
ncbi:hypothetical protein ACTVCO_08215 [Sanguibacter sp. A247]|uniref:hypothetical protein n=1 Tax=unclassified Sanguibacter TaxID=2645534 RepID=UPI003FD8E850